MPTPTVIQELGSAPRSHARSINTLNKFARTRKAPYNKPMDESGPYIVTDKKGNPVRDEENRIQIFDGWTMLPAVHGDPEIELRKAQVRSLSIQKRLVGIRGLGVHQMRDPYKEQEEIKRRESSQYRNRAAAQDKLMGVVRENAAPGEDGKIISSKDMK